MPEADTKPKFDVRGINHLALVVNDMAETKRFYTEVLGLPVIRSLELADGGQQAFFAITDHSIISAVWYPDAPDPGDAGIVNHPFGGVDEDTGQHLPGPPDLKQSAAGSMHHLAFTIPLAKQEQYKERLREHGIPCTEINHHIAYGNGKQAYHPTVLPNDAEAIDEFVNSIYFPDPDGRTFEFAAYTRPLIPDDALHTPAHAED